MSSKRLLWPVLAVALIACSDDNGSSDAGADVYQPGDGTPDRKLVPDLPKPDVDVSKRPVIDKMLPSDGFANATTKVVLTGKGFTQDVRVLIDGGAGDIIMNVVVASSVSMSFVMPQNPYGAPNFDKPQKVSVSVMLNTLVSNAKDFQYTVTLPMDATFKGRVLTATTSSYMDFPSELIEAQVFVEGITDTTTGDSNKIVAEIGFATVGKDPTKDDGWKWYKARFGRDETTGYDVYDGALTVPLVQTYDLAFRLSQDGGQSWIYADTDEADLTYDVAKAAKITATQAPANYCQVDGDCQLNAQAVMCLVDPVDKSKNQCVECKTDPDCAGNSKAFGPFCNQNLCYCKQSTDCTTNPNGHLCTGGYCGCQADTDCTAPAKCGQDPVTGMTTCM